MWRVGVPGLVDGHRGIFSEKLWVLLRRENSRYELLSQSRFRLDRQVWMNKCVAGCIDPVAFRDPQNMATLFC